MIYGEWAKILSSSHESHPNTHFDVMHVDGQDYLNRGSVRRRSILIFSSTVAHKGRTLLLTGTGTETRD